MFQSSMSIDWFLGYNWSYVTQFHVFLNFMKTWDIGLQFICREKNPVLLFWCSKNESKYIIWISPRILVPRHYLGFWAISRTSDVKKLQYQLSWKENMILYNILWNRELAIHTFSIPKLARNIRKKIWQSLWHIWKVISFPLKDKGSVYKLL